MLSELESFVLALISDGCTTGLSIIRIMKCTPASRWSTESGAVYRVIRKLETLGFVRMTGQLPNRRKSGRIEITELGQEMTIEWIRARPRLSEYAFLTDPLRTRAFFFAKLSSSDRAAVIQQWLADNEEFMKLLEKAIEDNTWSEDNSMDMNPYRQMSLKELVLLADARKRWLEDLGKL